ncbi:putative proline-rich receptor-like protein kinase PERK8 [Iris pallida]|uniref:Proline-rich receptor-like protein kinase PERK8 n=1 Tax=Iris pallida TaxID=29817 RepID=A0AAX6G5V9_IRIPA|nr:putative proline-rich receptor-like protein kinase PERK8 [Iris pallida]
MEVASADTAPHVSCGAGSCAALSGVRTTRMVGSGMPLSRGRRRWSGGRAG